MKIGYAETYRGYQIRLLEGRWSIVDEKTSAPLAEIPSWQSPYRRIDEELGDDE